MSKRTSTLSDWVYHLVQSHIPLELQKKMLSNAPLTKEEAQKYIDVITLITEAKSLMGIEHLEKRLESNTERILREIRNEREKVLDPRSPRERALIDAAVLLYTRNGLVDGNDVSMRQCFLHIWDRFNGANVFDTFDQFYQASRYDFENFYNRQALISRAKLMTKNTL